MRTINCQVCGKETAATGRSQRYCPSCAEQRHKEAQKRGNENFRRKQGRPVGVGKGGSNLRYTANPGYTKGLGQFRKLSREIKELRGQCERCGADLRTASRYEWCVHHIDHDRTHNTITNLTLLCKRCHQIEHKCWEAFEGATTIPRGSRGQEAPKRAASY